MKKFIAMLLALIMVCSLATTAFADGTTTQAPEFNDEDGQADYTGKLDKATKFTKAYLVKNGKSPAEDFAFTTEFVKFTDQHEKEGTVTDGQKPGVTLETAHFDAKDASTTAYTSDAKVEISNVTNDTPLGVYTYKITETIGNTAGVNYIATPVYLNVTVLRDEASNNHYVAAIHYSAAMDSNDKIGDTDNEYEAGQLTVYKQITGNMANMQETFTFKAVFTSETVEYTDAEGNETSVKTKFDDVQIVAANGTVIDATKRVFSNENGTLEIEFDLTGDNASATFINIPAGTTYTVEETVTKGYTQLATVYTKDGYTEGDFSIKNNDKDVVEFTNELKSEVDTGVALDSAPYFLMLAVAVIGMVALVSKKRYEV